MLPPSGYPIPYHPTWDWMDSSKMKCYSTCERLFFYRYVCGLERSGETKSRHLVIGDAWHKMMERVGLTHTVEGFEEVLTNLTINQLTTNVLEAAYIACMQHPLLSVAVTEALTYCYEEIPEETWLAYADTWSPKIPGRLPLALIAYINANREADSHYEMMLTDGKPMSEVGCQFQFTGDNVQWLFKARWDKVVRHKVFNQIIVREHKTSGNLANFHQEWELAIQPATYAAAMRMFFPLQEGHEAIVEMDGVSFLRTKLDKKKDVDPFRHNGTARCQVRKDHKAFTIWYNEVEARLEELERNYELLHEAKEADYLLRAFPMRTNSCHFMYGTPCQFVTYCQAYANPLQPLLRGQLLESFRVNYWDPDEHKPAKVTLQQHESVPVD